MEKTFGLYPNLLQLGRPFLPSSPDSIRSESRVYRIRQPIAFTPSNGHYKGRTMSDDATKQAPNVVAHKTTPTDSAPFSLPNSSSHSQATKYSPRYATRPTHYPIPSLSVSVSCITRNTNQKDHERQHAKHVTNNNRLTISEFQFRIVSRVYKSRACENRRT